MLWATFTPILVVLCHFVLELGRVFVLGRVLDGHTKTCLRTFSSATQQLSQYLAILQGGPVSSKLLTSTVHITR